MQTLPLPPRSEYRGPERRLSAAGRGPRPALAPCEASTVLRGVRGGRRQTPVTADAPSCPSPLGVLSTTSTIASSPLQLCTVDGRSAGTACAEILTSWPTRRPFRRELGVRGVPRRLRMSRLEVTINITIKIVSKRPSTYEPSQPSHIRQSRMSRLEGPVS